MQERIIGLDVGTTGTRAIVFDPQGKIYASASGEYPVLSPQPGYGEQEPEAIFTAVMSALKDAIAEAGLKPTQITGIGVSAVMHSMIALDADNRPLTTAWTWVDTRASEQAKRIKRETDPQALYERTGCPVHAMYTPAKAAFLQETAPEVFAKTRHIVTIKQYLLQRMFGRHMLDVGIASGSGLLNMQRRDWDEEAMALGGIRREQLPDLLEPTDLVSDWLPEIAAELGISPHTPLAIGSSDGTLSSLGSGAVNPGQMTAMIGTSGAVRAVSDVPRVDKEARTWCYYLAADRWVAGAAINNAGIAYRWIRDSLLAIPEGERSEAYNRLNKEAAKIGVGSEGLIFLPFLAGERAPYWNADARGVFLGLALTHEQPHIVRAALEGVAYRMHSIYVALRDLVGKPNEIRASGGFTRSPLWLQILSDVFGEPLRVPVVQESSSFGAAYLAMLGLGLADRIDDITMLVDVERQVSPDAANHARYARLFELYMETYWQLQQQFSEISALQREFAAAANDAEA